MDRNIFIGDTVKTQYGEGIVHDARSWREAVVDMDDYEAREFSDKCSAEVGLGFVDDWVELIVSVGGRMRRMLGNQVTVLEGRDEAR